jgi:3'-phosphoadenosine 5'-phosphosulfate sulfotransferase (PAPS reductase)/FAD synthetase
MNDPFKITGPTCISFSGGRTSAYMLWRVLQSYGGVLPDETIVHFANTGKEDEATLKFIQACSDNWNVPITWLEYQHEEPFFKVVNFQTASRNGEPFEDLIRNGSRKYLPNPMTRYCTVDLKIKVAQRYLFSIGWTEWDNLVGIRADEARRVAKIRANPSSGNKGITRFMPLAEAGITKETVGDFWRNQSFDLELPNINGVTYHGNCDLCFLKGGSQVLSLITEKPERAIWWVKMEALIESPTIANGGVFRADRPSYASMTQFASEQRDMFDPNEEAIACFCGD